MDHAGKIFCPCNHCYNNRKFPIDEVRGHLFRWGIWSSYEVWTKHGEVVIPVDEPKKDNVMGNMFHALGQFHGTDKIPDDQTPENSEKRVKMWDSERCLQQATVNKENGKKHHNPSRAGSMTYTRKRTSLILEEGNNKTPRLTEGERSQQVDDTLKAIMQNKVRELQSQTDSSSSTLSLSQPEQIDAVMEAARLGLGDGMRYRVPGVGNPLSTKRTSTSDSDPISDKMLRDYHWIMTSINEFLVSIGKDPMPDDMSRSSTSTAGTRPTKEAIYTRMSRAIALLNRCRAERGFEEVVPPFDTLAARTSDPSRATPSAAPTIADPPPTADPPTTPTSDSPTASCVSRPLMLMKEDYSSDDDTTRL